MELTQRLSSALWAASWLGTREGSREHRELLAHYNAIRPLPRGYAMTASDPWCAAFVSAAVFRAGAGERYPLECSCSKIVEQAKHMGIWQERDDHRPLIADWVLYNWQAADTGDDQGAPDHVGMVVGVDGMEMMVVEGNFDNSVKLRKLRIDDRRIRGFVCPKYPEEVETVCYHTLEEVPAYARATIEKLTQDGSLRGISEDDLGLSEELVRVLVILDRRGIL